MLCHAVLAAACGGLGGLPPEVPPLVKGPDGHEHRIVAHGAYSALYDRWGRIERIDYDSNGDGRPDHIAHYEGRKTPSLIEVDEDFDGWVDRWEHYDDQGNVVKVGTSRRGGSEDTWTYTGPGGDVVRKEYDDDGDGRVDRAEIFRDGRLVASEIDSDRDGRFDRWQTWQDGRLRGEELDTDADGTPDRRIAFGTRGEVASVESLRRE